MPHDWSIEGDFTTQGEAESGFLLGGTAWYRKNFVIPKELKDKKFVLNFDGVYMNAEVYVNGKLLGEHNYGYSAFAFDITNELFVDGKTENVIAVKVKNIIPTSRWYSGSGIYRDVTLNITNKIHVAHLGTVVNTPNLKSQQNGKTDVVVKTNIENNKSELKDVKLKSVVLDSNDNEVSEVVELSKKISPNGNLDFEQNLVVSNPKLWSTDSPNLYRVKSDVIVDGEIVDTYYTTFGFRYFDFDKDSGFSLNGKKMKLKGVSMHHDQGALGSASHYRAVERQMEIMKEMGVNAIRVTHNPASKMLLEICDKLGLLVINEAFDTWLVSKNGNANDFSKYFNATISNENRIINGKSGMTWGEFESRNMVKNSINHPSIIMWSIGNEVLEGLDKGVTADSYVNVATNIINWIRDEDKTRPVTIGDNKSKELTDSSTSESHPVIASRINDVITQNGGIVGFNYATEKQFNNLKNKKPNWTLYGSETSSAVHSRGYYKSRTEGKNENDLQLNEFDNKFNKVPWGHSASDAWRYTIKNDYNAGEFIWTGFDYIGEPTPWNKTDAGSASNKGAKPKSSYFGIVDTSGFPKDIYYLYQSFWNDDVNTLHILPTWNREDIPFVTKEKQNDSNSENQSNENKINEQNQSEEENGVSEINSVDENKKDETQMKNSTEAISEKNSKEFVEVDVFTDAYRVELYLNGRLIGSQTATEQVSNGGGYKYYTFGKNGQVGGVDDPFYPTFIVPFEEGEISAKAYDKQGNLLTNTQGRGSIKTYKNPSTVRLSSDKNSIKDDGDDLAYVTIDLVDNDGNIAYGRSNRLTYKLEGNGKIVGLDNGNASDNDKYKPLNDKYGERSAFHGKALVILQSTEEAGDMVLTVSGDGIAPQSIKIKTDEVKDKKINLDLVNVKSQINGQAMLEINSTFNDIKLLDFTKGYVQYKKSNEQIWSEPQRIEKIHNGSFVETINNLSSGEKYDFLVSYVSRVPGEDKEIKLSDKIEGVLISSFTGIISGGGSTPNYSQGSSGVKSSTSVVSNSTNTTKVDYGMNVSLPKGFNYDENSIPLVGYLKYKDKDGKIVTQDKEEFSNVKLSFGEGKIKIEGLVPGKKYIELKIDYVDKNGRRGELLIKDFEIENVNDVDKYLSNVYNVVFNRHGDEKGYHFHLKNLESKRTLLREFLMNMLIEKEFIETYKTTESKVEALYNGIVGRESDVQGKDFWVKEYRKLLSVYGDEMSTLKSIADRMVNENELKELANKINVKW